MGANQKHWVFGAAEQGGEARGRVEAGPAEPIDGTVASNQGSRLAIADHESSIRNGMQRHLRTKRPRLI